MSKQQKNNQRKTLADKPMPIDKTTLQARIILPDERFSGFLGYLPNPDEVLVDSGETIEVYRKMRADPRIKSLLNVAKTSVLNYPIHIDPLQADEKVIDLVNKALKKVSLYDLAKRKLRALDYGYAVTEIDWELVDGWWYPATLISRKPERFVFNSYGELRLRNQFESTDLMSQPYRWLVHQYDPDDENPYGTSVLKSCFWPWRFKKAGAEFWLMATEKFAVPSLLALFELQAGDTQTRERAQEIAAMLMQTQSGSGAALANIKDVKSLEASGALSEFKVLMDWCDTQIAYGIVAQSLAVQESKNGSKAQASVHEDTFEETARGICRDLVKPLQQLVNWIVELNFGVGTNAPQVLFELDDYADWEKVRDAIDRGVPVSKAALYKRYGLPEPVEASDSFVDPKSAAGSTITTTPTDINKTEPITQGINNASDVQSTALNGAQVSSLVDLATQVAQGVLPADSARAIAAAAFPLVDSTTINEIFNPLLGFQSLTKEKPVISTTLSDDVKKKSRPVMTLHDRN